MIRKANCRIFNKSITLKILGSFIIISLVAVIIGFFFLQSQIQSMHQQIDYKAEEKNNISREFFYSIINQDTASLSSVIDAFANDENYKKLFLDKEKDAIYDSLLPFFRSLNEKYGITHFNFIEEDGKVFLRMHDINLSGDYKISTPLSKAMHENDTAHDIELGKTAFALRVVKPYNEDNRKIGYIEIGQEIDYIVTMLQKNTRNHFVMVADKEHINKDYWSSAMQWQNKKNNWDDLDNFVIISSTLDNQDYLQCTTQYNIDRIVAGNQIHTEEITINGSIYTCRGFKLVNSEGTNLGAIITFIDITEDTKFIERSSSLFILFIVALLLLTVVTGALVSLKITRPIKHIHEAIKKIKAGNLSTRTDVKTNDELEELSKSFNEMVERIQHTDEEYKLIEQAKTDFLSITSHELRSPITPMKAQIQMMIKGYYGKINPRQKKSAEMILRNTNRLDKIISDILDVSRIETARLKFYFIKTNIKKEAEQLIQSIKTYMPEKKIRIINRIRQIPDIETDPDRIMQVLRNLLQNSIKFSDNGKRVWLDIKKAGNHLLFEVRDEGIGILPDNKKRIFKPFFQEEHALARKHEGVGLGLAICRGIIESQNGKIWVESERGKGSSFFFTLPLKPNKDIRPIKYLFGPRNSGLAN